MADTKSDAEAIIAAVERLTSLSTMTVEDRDGTERTVIAVPNGVSIKSVKPLLDEYRTRPERKCGTCNVTDLDSFIAQVDRFCSPHSVIFANRTQMTLTAVIDYHEAAGGLPDWCQHRIHYAMPLSREWLSWRKINGEKQAQGDFCEFIEDRIADVLPPPTSDDLTDARFPGLTQFAAVIGGRWAGPQDMVALSRGLQVHVESKVKDARNLSTGEARVQFETEHRDATGELLRVPSLFLLGIPVFEGGPLYRIPVRLRYRVSSGAISWICQLWQPDEALRHAFREACETAEKATGLPVFQGRLET